MIIFLVKWDNFNIEVILVCFKIFKELGFNCDVMY